MRGLRMCWPSRACTWRSWVLGLFWVVRAVLAAIPCSGAALSDQEMGRCRALCSAAFYLIISGAASASTRAFVMLAMMLMAILLDRPALSMRSLALAAAIILLLGPESLIEPGFQMSFAAVVDLIAVAEWEATRPQREVGVAPPAFAEVRRYVRGIAITSFVGSIATVPFAIFHFDRATHYCGARQSARDAGHGLCRHAGGGDFRGADAVWSRCVAAAGPGLGHRIHAGGRTLGLRSAGRGFRYAGVARRRAGSVSLGGLWIGLWRKSWRWLGLVPFVAGIAVAYWPPQPDLLVGRDGATVALRAPDGSLKLFRPAKDEYSADEWLKRDGDGRARRTMRSRPGLMASHCDALGCIAVSAPA